MLSQLPLRWILTSAIISMKTNYFTVCNCKVLPNIAGFRNFAFRMLKISSAEQHLSSKLCLLLFAESHHSRAFSWHQLPDKALLPLVSHMLTSSSAILDLALSACYSRIYQGLSFSHQLFCMPTSSSCCDIFDQVVYAYYQRTYLRAWLQAPHFSPPHQPWPWAAFRTAPLNQSLRRSAATWSRSAIGENRSKPHKRSLSLLISNNITLESAIAMATASSASSFVKWPLLALMTA